MRQSSRIVLRAAKRLRAFNSGDGELLGMVADLSNSGLRLLTEQPLTTGNIYRIDLEVPINRERFRVLELVVNCQWSKRNARLDRFEQGLALSEPAGEFSALVDSLLLAEERVRNLGG